MSNFLGAVQIMMDTIFHLSEAHLKMRSPDAYAIMAVAYGDQWTNMWQPFWALPVLAIAGLRMRDILGYTTLTLIGSGAVMMTTLWIISM